MPVEAVRAGDDECAAGTSGAGTGLEAVAGDSGGWDS